MSVKHNETAGTSTPPVSSPLTQIHQQPQNAFAEKQLDLRVSGTFNRCSSDNMAYSVTVDLTLNRLADPSKLDASRIGEAFRSAASSQVSAVFGNASLDQITNVMDGHNPNLGKTDIANAIGYGVARDPVFREAATLNGSKDAVLSQGTVAVSTEHKPCPATQTALLKPPGL